MNILINLENGKNESENWIQQPLIEEFKDKHSGNVALIRQELQERYKSGRDRDAIALAFSNSIVSDQQWVKNQEKKR